MQKNNIKGSLILLLAALLWGFAFVAQCDASDKISPFAFNCMRSLIGSFVLAVYILIKDKFIVGNQSKALISKSNIIAGAVCGFLLMFAINFQQYGIFFYPKGVAVSARSGFITALYVILVPLFSVFLKKKIPLTVWTGVTIAVLGVYLLCLSNGFSGIYLGDILMFFCAITFALHILVVDKFCTTIDGVLLSMLQFLFCGIFSGILSLFFEEIPKIADIQSALPQILYLGIMSCGVAYTLQIVGQKYAEPTIASISMSFEGVFAALGGWLVFGNKLSLRELFGCVLLFIAVIIAQLPTPKFSTKKEK